MRTQDIKVGEHYAVAPQSLWNLRRRSTVHQDQVWRYRVEKTGVEIMTGTGNVFKYGVQVERVKDGEGTGIFEVVPASLVRQPWDEWVEWAANTLTEERESERARERALAERADQLRALWPESVEKPQPVETVLADDAYPYQRASVIFSTPDFLAMLTALKAAWSAGE